MNLEYRYVQVRAACSAFLETGASITPTLTAINSKSSSNNRNDGKNSRTKRPPPCSVLPRPAPPLLLYASSDIYSYSTLEEYGVRVMLDRLNLTSKMSSEAADLLCHILVVDRVHRPCSAEGLVRHPFFAEYL